MIKEYNSMVSVIMPLYNAEAYMRKSINSILEQTYENIELILIDDGSIDRTLLIAQKLALIDKRITILSQDNSGPGAARNKALDECKGQFVCFVDSDDFLEKHAIQVMVMAMEDKCDLVQCRAQKVYTDNTKDSEPWNSEQIVLSSYDAMKDYLYNSKPIVRYAVWAKLFRRNVIGDTRFPAIYNSEDVVFNARIINKCRQIKYITDVLYFVTIRSSSLSHQKITEKKISSTIKCNEYLLELLQSDESYSDFIGRMYWSIVMSIINIAVTLQKENSSNKRQLIKQLRKYCKALDISGEYFNIKQKTIRYMFQLAPYSMSQFLRKIL